MAATTRIIRRWEGARRHGCFCVAAIGVWLSLVAAVQAEPFQAQLGPVKFTIGQPRDEVVKAISDAQLLLKPVPEDDAIAVFARAKDQENYLGQLHFAENRLSSIERFLGQFSEKAGAPELISALYGALEAEADGDAKLLRPAFVGTKAVAQGEWQNLNVFIQFSSDKIQPPVVKAIKVSQFRGRGPVLHNDMSKTVEESAPFVQLTVHYSQPVVREPMLER